MKINRKYLVIAVAIIGVLFLTLGGAYWLLKPVSSNCVPVISGPVASTLLANGNMLDTARSELSFGQNGKIAQVSVLEGDKVSKGQLLAAQDTPELLNLKALRTAELEQAAANLQRLQNYDRLQVEEELQQAQRDEEVAKLQLERDQQLFEAEALSQVELSHSQNNLEKAGSQRKSVEIRLGEIQGPLLQAARSQLQQSRIRLQEAEIRYQSAYIRAPFDGEVLQVLSNVGQYAAAGQTALIVLPSTEEKIAAVEVDEEYIGQIQEGQTAQITSGATSGESYAAVINWVAPFVKAETGTFTVHLSLEGETPLLSPGAAVFAEILTDKEEEALLVEQQYIYEVEEGAYVYLLKEERAVKQYIETGPADGLFRKVLEGLTEGDCILTAPNLKDKQRVHIQSGGAG